MPREGQTDNGTMRLIRRLLVAAGFLLPTLTLIPFGWVWLWQNGYVVPWVLGLFVSTALAFAGQLWLTRRLERRASPPPAQIAAGRSSYETPRETAARAAVTALARETDPLELQSRDGMMALGVRTVETVAHHMHPGERDPVWNFTLPEALALIEATAARLRPVIVENVPLGDRISVAQALRIYRWRGAIDVADKAYDLWRLVRLANPLTALTYEAREQMTKKLYAGIKDEVARRIVRIYVEEVGRAAIDLYSGRLRRATDVATDNGSGTFARAPPVTAPLRLLVAGQTSAGKSSLVNALVAAVVAEVDALPATAGFTGYELVRDGLPQALVVDTPGVSIDAAGQERLAKAALESDLVLWVAGANRADRDIDRRALDALRTSYRDRIERRPPPMLLVLTHIDRLRPFREWSPPYDVANPTTAKAQSIREAMDAAAADLDILPADIVPVCLDHATGLTNIDILWARIAAALPDAEGARLARLVSAAETSWSWRTVMTQAANAGRILGGAVVNAVRDER